MRLYKLFTAVALMAIVFAATAQAEVVPFQWSSSGSFSAPGLPAGLTFAGAGLSAVTNTDSVGNLNIDVARLHSQTYQPTTAVRSRLPSTSSDRTE